MQPASVHGYGCNSSTCMGLLKVFVLAGSHLPPIGHTYIISSWPQPLLGLYNFRMMCVSCGMYHTFVGPPMSVTVASFQLKGDFKPDSSNSSAGANSSKKKAGGAGGGGGGGGGKRGGGGGSRGSKASQQQKLEKKLGWGGFDDQMPPEKVSA
jgi:hypothetical protein